MQVIENILVVPDSFKSSLTAEEVAKQISDGLQYYKDKLKVETFPFADGGEGSLEVVQKFTSAIERTCFTFDAKLKPIRASYLIDEENQLAYIESAKVIGIEVLEQEPDCYNSSSYGLGIMIKDALEQGVKKIYLFLGGSATSDGGVGMAAGLGYDFLLEKRIIERPLARDVKYIHEYKTENVLPSLSECEFVIGYDVENPLYGENGSAFTFARQKGASDEQIELLELAMLHLGRIIALNKHVDIQKVKGSGAAGGLGAGAYFFLDGTLKSGFEILTELSGLEEKIKSNDLIITGEGHIDEQSFQGKMISQIKKLADKHNKPVWLISAIRSISEKEALKMGYQEIKSLYKSLPKTIDIPETKHRLNKTAKNWAAKILNIR